MHGMVRHTSSITIGLLPDFKQMRMSARSVQVGSLTAKPVLTAFLPQSYYSPQGDLESFVCLQWEVISLCVLLQKTQQVFPLVASGKSWGERR